MEFYFTIISNLLGAIAICLSTYAYIITKRESIYSSLDDMYNDILKIGIENPKFRDIHHTSEYLTAFVNDAERIAYETYAYIVLNWCETVIDRASKTKNLAVTWFPAVRTEYNLHKNWFLDPANSDKYKEDFHKNMRKFFDK